MASPRPHDTGSNRAPPLRPLLKLEEFLPYRLNVLASLTSEALSRAYGRHYGIGLPEWRVLVTLGEFGTMTGKAVGTHSHMHKTKVSRAVAMLERRRLVTRRPNRTDMRESLLSLSPSGRLVYEALVPVAVEFSRRLEEVIDPADRAAFDRALRRLAECSATLAVETLAGEASQGSTTAAEPSAAKTMAAKIMSGNTMAAKFKATKSKATKTQKRRPL